MSTRVGPFLPTAPLFKCLVYFQFYRVQQQHERNRNGHLHTCKWGHYTESCCWFMSNFECKRFTIRCPQWDMLSSAALVFVSQTSTNHHPWLTFTGDEVLLASSVRKDKVLIFRTKAWLNKQFSSKNGGLFSLDWTFHAPLLLHYGFCVPPLWNWDFNLGRFLD